LSWGIHVILFSATLAHSLNLQILDVLYNRNSSGGVVLVHPEECIKSVSVGDLCLVAPGNIQMTYGLQKRYHEEGA
jgi:hypothetical protein